MLHWLFGANNHRLHNRTSAFSFEKNMLFCAHGLCPHILVRLLCFVTVGYCESKLGRSVSLIYVSRIKSLPVNLFLFTSITPSILTLKWVSCMPSYSLATDPSFASLHSKGMKGVWHDKLPRSVKPRVPPSIPLFVFFSLHILLSVLAYPLAPFSIPMCYEFICR